ncbi:MAG: ABC transporter substrate-binding protein [Acidimicrobiales bacterium]|nr:ABC transporter substrate-binding protein [Acidimicrobiales bacterium]
MNLERPRTLWRSALLVAVLVLTASGCGSDSGGERLSAGAASEPVTVRLGYFPNITHAPALVGVQKGFFAEKLGANKLETKAFNAGPEAVEAIFAGTLDIAYIGPNPAINAFQKSNGEAIRIVSGCTSGGAYLVTRPEITTAADLKGKTVASPQLGNTQDVALRSWLKENGLTADVSGGGDVHIKPQENADTLNALKSGEIAGAWVPEPWATRLIQEAGAKVLVDERTLWPEGRYVTTLIVVAKKFLDAHPDVVKQVLEGHLAALDFIAADPTGAQKLANKEIEAVTGKPLQDKVIAAAWPNLEFTSDPIASSLQKSVSDAKAAGLLKSDDVSGIYDLSILNQLLVDKGQPAIAGRT